MHDRRHPRRSYLPLVPGLLLAAAALLALPVALGCGDDEAGDGLGRDGGAGGGPDAGLVLDAGPSPPSSDGGTGLSGEDDAPAGVGCFDFVDTDGDGALDCDDEDCARTAVCCVGSSSDACCAETATEALAFRACEGAGTDALLACAPAVALFGSPSPELRDGALIPNGGDRFDSGIVLATAVDPRVSRLVIEATIAAGEGCERCLDSVAVGLTGAEQSLGSTTLVDAGLALMVSTARGEVQLLVGGALASTLALSDVRARVGAAENAAIDYRLETTTDGLATLSASTGTGERATLFGDVPFAPRGPARVIAWGRSANRAISDPPAARIEHLSLTERVCDAPASLARGGEPILPDALDAWWLSGERASAPSVAAYDDALGERRARMAFVYQGRIHVAGGIEGGRFRAMADPRDPANAILAPGGAEWMAAGVADPELVRGADARWHLWFTGIAADGSRSIGRADAAAPDQLVLGAPVRVLAPDAAAGTLGWDGPSLASATIDGVPRAFLAARRWIADASGATTAIVLFELDALGAEAAPIPADTTIFDPGAGEVREHSDLVRGPTGTPSDFDADEVAAPALVAYGGVLRLYYAGRRGTRWSIGAMLSQDARHWREANDGRAVLTGSGAGFDALSVSDPAPIVEGAELRLYYTGTDGVRAAVGLARHAIPELGAAP